MLNSHTSEKLRAGISTIELARNFQDAILFTHQMGLFYIWIDSLCIMQDDLQDWARESAQMDKIYYNAAIVIAASQAKDSLEGFLDKRTQRSYTPTNMTFSGIYGEVTIYPVPLRLAGDPTRLAEMENEPLTARGWALQERYMAQRTVHFTQDQVLLESKGEVLAEDSGFAVHLPSRSPFALRSRTGKDIAWTQVVERYSKRKLTRAQGKLPALAGLAAYFSSIYEDRTSNQENRYLAGLWSLDLVKHLCWQVPYKQSPQARPGEYRAPTWSWASIDGHITFRKEFIESLIIVRDAQVELERLDNIFGQVTGGRIFLSAIRLKPHAISENGQYFLLSDKGMTFRVDTHWDTEERLTKEEMQHAIIEERFVVVPVAWQKTPKPLEFAGPLCLILTPVRQGIHSIEGILTYKRVGSGIARPDKQSVDLLEVIIPTWTDAFENGDLVDIVVV